MKYKIYISFLLGFIFCHTGYGQIPNWEVNAESYRYNMSLVATGEDSCFAPMSTADIIGVFDAAGACRGKGHLISFSAGYRAVMTIYGNDLTDTLYYRVYDASTDQIILSADTLEFAPEVIKGSINLPETISAVSCEVDTDGDGDGLTDNEEITGIDDPSTPANPNGYTSNPTIPDTDGDGLNDGQEGLNITNPNDTDTDGDGLSDNEEVTGVDDAGTVAEQPTGMVSNPNSICDPLQLAPSCVNNACVNITAHVWLEGAYADGAMNTKLNDLGYLPGQDLSTFLGTETASGQPYNRPPWNYAGTEGSAMNYTIIGDAKAGYSSTVVDWVLVSLRTEADSAAVCTRAALVHADGHIEFVSGSDCCEINTAETYYIVIEHRNHLIIMSHQPMPVVNGTITYDFRVQESYNVFLGFGQKSLGEGTYMMHAGNGDQSSENNGNRILNIINSDKEFWLNENGQHSSYYINDFDLNGDVNIQDKNIWLDNNGKFSDIKWENGGL